MYIPRYVLPHLVWYIYNLAEVIAHTELKYKHIKMHTEMKMRIWAEAFPYT